jgi:site-specific DNA-adenine methylase
MKTPTFAIIGGKSRLRGWLINLFPKEGRIYVEPFAGRGNVFFKAKQELDFQEWHVNDICGDFLHALLKTDLQTLPSTIQDKKSWDKWKKKAEEGDPRGHLLEPEVTWGGKGWRAGVKGFTTKGGHPPYNREKFIPRAEMARELLSGDNVKITSNSWESLPWGEYSHQDFVYLDPPYHEVMDYYCKQAVDHEALL